MNSRKGLPYKHFASKYNCLLQKWDALREIGRIYYIQLAETVRLQNTPSPNKPNPNKPKTVEGSETG